MGTDTPRLPNLHVANMHGSLTSYLEALSTPARSEN